MRYPKPTPAATPTIFGLIAWLENTRIQLPLRAVDCHFRVTGEVGVVELDQVFQQTASESLNVTYTFPLPHGAAVYRCEMHVNGRVIRARVMEEAEARRVVEEQKHLGHRTALVQADRENVFRLELGNLAPGDIVVLRLAYFQTLDRLETQLSLRIPFCPGIRYIPGEPLLRANRGKGAVDDTDQVPDASCISPPRIDRLHPDAAELHIEGILDGADVTLSTLSSPTHPAIIRPQEGKLQVRLAETETLPDRDFVLRWDESVVAQALTHTWSTRDEHGTYALMQVRAPREVAVHEAWEQDIYFLVDRSGSMQGMKWTKCAEALMEFVKELGGNDRVWITFFETKHHDFAEAPMNAPRMMADPGFQNIAQLGATGGTELRPALQHVLEVRKRFSENRRSRMVIITDGQVGNEMPILECLEGAGPLPVYCFGIDTTVNDTFLKKLSRLHGGRCVLMTPHDDIPAAVQKLARALRRPVLTGLRISDGWTMPDGLTELPDLHEGEVTRISLRSMNGELAPLRITGRKVDNSAWNGEGIITPDQDPAPRLLWAQQRIGALLANNKKTEAVALAVENNLACVGASFVAWDDAEKVPVAQREVYQPAMEPEREVFSLMKAAPSGISKCSLSRNFFEGTVTDFQKSSVLSGGLSLRADLSIPDVKQRLAEMKAKYMRPLQPEKGKEVPLIWNYRLFLSLGGFGDPQVKDIVEMLAWLLFDWSTRKDEKARNKQIDDFLKSLRGRWSAHVHLKEFVAASLGSPHQQDALWLLEAIVWNLDDDDL